MKFYYPKYFFTAVLLCGSNLMLNAQLPDYRFENYFSKDGFPAEVTGKIVQDKKGYLWFPTKHGLYRYDGNEFKRYIHIAGDSTSLGSNVIQCVTEDSSGKFWVATFGGGLNLFDPNTGKAKKILLPHTESNVQERTYAPLIDSHNILWFGNPESGGGLIRYELSSKKIERIDLGKDEKIDALKKNQNFVGAIVEDKHGDLFFGSWDGVWILDHNTGAFRIVRVPEKDYAKRQGMNTVLDMLVDEQNNVWCGNWGGGLQKVNKHSGTIEVYLPTGEWTYLGNKNIVVSIAQKNKNELWVSSIDQGLGIFNLTEKKFYFFRNDAANPYSVGTNVGANMSKLKDGTLWMGSEPVVKLNLQNQPFPSVTLPVKKYMNRNLPLISAFYQSEENYFLAGTDWSDGLYFFDDKNKPGKLIPFPVKDDSPVISQIVHDKKGNVLVASSSGLLRFDAKEKSLKYFPEKSEFAATRFLSIHEDENGNLWFPSRKGIYFLSASRRTSSENTATNEWKRITLPLTTDSENSFSALAIPPGGNILTSTRLGLLCEINAADFNINVIKKTNLENASEIRDMIYDSQSNLWISQYGNGIARCDSGDAAHGNFMFRFLNETAGEDFNRLIFDGNGFLWALSDNKIIQINPIYSSIKNFTSFFGLHPGENFENIYSGNNKRLVVASGMKYFSFDPASILLNRTPPPVVINSFKIFDKEFPLKEKNGKYNLLSLNYDQNYFSFEFAALNYNEPEKNQYAYQLEGIDKNWIYCGMRRYASYNDLPGGNYIFHVKASNNDGVWNEAGVSIPIFVTTPWWKATWFYVLLTLAVASMTFMVYRFRLNQLLKVEHMRMRIASDLHDDIGSSLTGIAYYSELMKMQMKEKNAAAENLLGKIGDSSRDIVTAMGDIVWAINPKNDLAENLAERMKRLAAEYLLSRNIPYLFEAGESVGKLSLNMEQRKNFYLVFKEALNNLIKYAECTGVKISLHEKNNQLLLLVEDNGKGFNPGELLGEGNGLISMKQRAEEMKGSFEIDSERGKGTRVLLKCEV